MAKKKGKRRVKAERGTLFKNNKLFGKKNSESTAKKFVKNLENSEDLELTPKGEKYFDEAEKQKIVQNMEAPVLYDSNKFNFINLENAQSISLKKTDLKDIKHILPSKDGVWFFMQNSAVLKNENLETVDNFEYDFESKLAPVIYDDDIYFSLEKNIKIYNLKNKSWEDYEISGIPIAPISTDGNNFYVVTDYSKLTCYDIEFKELWTFSTQRYLLNVPVYKDKHIFVTSTDGILYQLEKEEGELIWSYNFKTPLETPAINFNDLVALNSMDGKIHILSPEKKDEVYSFDTGFALFHKPVLINKDIYSFNRTFIFKTFIDEDNEFKTNMYDVKRSIEIVFQLFNKLFIVDNEASCFIMESEENFKILEHKSHKQPIQCIEKSSAFIQGEDNILYNLIY